MNINITLLVQVCHFWFAYMVLRYFIFAPVYEIILFEKNDDEAKKVLLKKLNEQIAHCLERRSRNWHDLVENYKYLIPTGHDTNSTQFPTATEHFLELTHEEKKLLIQETVLILRKGILHGNE